MIFNVGFLSNAQRSQIRLRVTILGILIAVSLSACTVHHTFNYEPEEIDDAAKTDLRIAVMPFRENRKHVDDGSTGWAYVPLVPTAAKTVDAPQDESARSRAEYYYPDLIAYALALDLIHNHVGSLVHLNPPTLEHYDIVIEGSLDGLPITTRKLTYGVGPAAFLLTTFGFPSGANAVEVQATYAVNLPGEESPIYEKQHTGDYVATQWSGQEKEFSSDDIIAKHGAASHIHGIVEGFHEVSEAFLVDAAPVIQNQAAGHTEKDARFSYYRRLDPELREFEATLKRTSGSIRARVAREYKKRLKILEKYRQKEWQRVVEQQNYRNETLARRLVQIANIRGQQINIKRQQYLAEEKREREMQKQFFSALSAGLMPATRAMSQQGSDNSQTWSMLAKDVGNAMSALPPAPPPVADSRHLIDRIDRNMTGLEGIGSDPFDLIEGATVEELRAKFLRLYRDRTTPLRFLV